MKLKLILLSILAAILGGVIYAQEVIQTTNTYGSTVAEPVSWSELLAMFSLLAGFVGTVQWVVVRVLMDPMIRSHAESMKAWAEKMFPTHIEFNAHIKADEVFQERMDRDFEQVWKQLEKRDK